MAIIEIIDGEGSVANTIMADEAFAQQHYPDAWRVASIQDAPAPLPQAVRHITSQALRWRLTVSERAAIEWAAVDRADATEVQRKNAATLRSMLKDQDQAQFIDLDDIGVASYLLLIEELQLIAPGRASEILGAPIQPGERP